MNIGLGEKERKEIAEILIKILATTYSLYLKTQNFHWNVKGSDFYALHIMFQKQYEELAEAIDEIAERGRAMDHFIPGSFSEFETLSEVKGESEFLQAKEMLNRLLSGHETLIIFLRKKLPVVEGFGDGATADLINKRLATHEKVAWMLRSQI